jgi:hypothetical protein
MGVGNLAEQHPRGSHKLFKCQSPTNQQTGKLELTQHDPVEQPGKDDGQATQASLKQPQPQGIEQPQGWGLV